METCLDNLCNRVLFHERLQQALGDGQQSGSKVAVVALTLDRYHGIKASLGPDACSALLQHAVSTMADCLAEDVSVARLLGNEFALILPGLAHEDEVFQLLATLLDAVKAPMQWHGKSIGSTASIGVALDGDATDTSGLLRCANVAAVHAAGLGGNRFRFYAQAMNERAARRSSMQAQLRRAINEGQLELHFPSSAEACLLWRHPSRGILVPHEFIPQAEGCGMAAPLVAWLVREACRQQRVWREMGHPIAPLTIRLSPHLFHADGVAEHVEVMLASNSLPRNMLVIQLEESAENAILAADPPRSNTMLPLWRAINNKG